MTPITIIIAVFSVLAALDRIFGSKLGLGKEFEKGLHFLGSLALSMIGMIVISPLIADLLEPFFDTFYSWFGIDPSIITATLLANDMGGAPLSAEVAKNADIGAFNGLIVAAMMGCTISFTIPCSMEVVKKELHKDMMLGYLCGIVTIPFGCFVAGLALKINIGLLLLDLLPLVLFGAIVGCGLVFCPKVCVKVFSVIGYVIKVLITIGLVLGILSHLLGHEIVKGLASVDEAALVCFNSAIVMTGAFPLMYVLARLLKKPLRAIGSGMGINETSAMGFIATLATAMSTYEMINSMDRKGIVLNSAFLISAGFVFAGHLAFTMAFDASYVPYVIIAKLVAGVLAFALAYVLYPHFASDKKESAAA